MSTLLAFPLPPRRPALWVVLKAELKGLSVTELYGDEAESAWAAACLNLYLDPDERAFAPTTPGLLT